MRLVLPGRIWYPYALENNTGDLKNGMFARIKKWIPAFVVVPYLVTWIINMAAFYIGKLSPFQAIEIETAWDRALPFVPAFILIYVLAFVQWIVGYLIIMRDGRDTIRKVFPGEILAKTIAFIIFFFMPTVMQRPEVTGHGLFDWLTRFIYFMDTPTCLFPSVHCLVSWICWRGTHYMKHVSKTYQVCMFVFTLLVFAAVLLVKQHLIVDVLGGVAVAEIGLFLAPRLKLDRIFEACCSAIERRVKIRYQENEENS